MWYAEVPGLKGLWASSGTLEACRKELIRVLEEWIVLKLRDGDVVPKVDGLSVHIIPVAVA
jgi:predicted RNase H-like HicB family nuclease